MVKGYEIYHEKAVGMDLTLPVFWGDGRSSEPNRRIGSLDVHTGTGSLMPMSFDGGSLKGCWFDAIFLRMARPVLSIMCNRVWINWQGV